MLRRPYSEHTQRVIDEEVATLLRQAEERAATMLRDHCAALDRLAALLVEQETVDGAEVRKALVSERDMDRPAATPPTHGVPPGSARVRA